MMGSTEAGCASTRRSALDEGGALGDGGDKPLQQKRRPPGFPDGLSIVSRAAGLC
jgi:hypothetical protein